MESDGIVTAAGAGASNEPAGTREPRLLGLTLAQYAGIHAGLAAGFPLDAVLANEGVEPAVYTRAMLAWSELLAEDLDRDGTPLNEGYDARLARAQDRYGRRVDPLADDLRAWLCFVRCLSGDPDPPALLLRLGLRAADVVRLHRAWARQFELDATLLREAQSVLESEPGPLPDLSLEPARLVPPEPPDIVAFQDLDPVESDDDLDETRAEDDEEPTSADAEEIPPLFAPLDALDPEMSGAFTQPTSPRGGPHAQRETDPALRPAEPSRERPHDLARPTRPGTEPPAPAARRELPSFLLNEAHAPPDEFTSTTAPLPDDLSAHPPMEPLPFHPALHSLEAPSASDEVLDVTPPPCTADPDSIAAARRPLPFLQPRRVEPGPPPEQRSGRAALGSQPDFGPSPPPGTTTGPIQIPKGPVLPFRPPAEGHGSRPSPPPPPAQPSPPGHRSAAEPLEVLSLAQYASLCAELAASPKSAEAIFRRYGLDTREKRSAVDAAWKERLGRDPAEYASWQEMYRRYQAYWTKQGAP
jgi:hypothetical protein